MKTPPDDTIPTDGCLNACVAYLFSVPCKAVPRFDLARDSREQSRLLAKWLKKKGFFVVELEDHKHVPTLHIACGPIKGDNRSWHAVVCRGNKLIYNPENDVTLSSIWERFVIAPIDWLSSVKSPKIATQRHKKRSNRRKGKLGSARRSKQSRHKRGAGRA